MNETSMPAETPSKLMGKYVQVADLQEFVCDIACGQSTSIESHLLTPAPSCQNLGAAMRRQRDRVARPQGNETRR